MVLGLASGWWWRRSLAARYTFGATLTANGVTPEQMMRVVNNQVPTPFTDAIATDWYRRRMVGVFVTRALRQLAPNADILRSTRGIRPPGCVVVGFALLHGLAWGLRGPQMAAIRADYFGRKNFGTILGVSNGLIIIGTISGPIIAGAVYDITGNYRIGFDITAALATAGSLFFVLAPKPVHPLDREIADVTVER